MRDLAGRSLETGWGLPRQERVVRTGPCRGFREGSRHRFEQGPCAFAQVAGRFVQKGDGLGCGCALGCGRGTISSLGWKPELHGGRPGCCRGRARGHGDRGRGPVACGHRNTRTYTCATTFHTGLRRNTQPRTRSHATAARAPEARMAARAGAGYPTASVAAEHTADSTVAVIR